MKPHWPENLETPLGIKNDFNWQELGAVIRILGQQNVQLVVETGVGRGDLAAWIMAIMTFNPDLSYVGITNDPQAVDPRVIGHASNSTQAFIAVGAPCGQIMLDRVRRLIRNSSAAMVICNGAQIDREVDVYLDLLRTGDVLVAHRFLEEYSGRKLIEMSRNGQLDRFTGDWLSRTRLIAGVVQ